jgi:hypothetical protein
VAVIGRFVIALLQLQLVFPSLLRLVYKKICNTMCFGQIKKTSLPLQACWFQKETNEQVRLEDNAELQLQRLSNPPRCVNLLGCING